MVFPKIFVLFDKEVISLEDKNKLYKKLKM